MEIISFETLVLLKQSGVATPRVPDLYQVLKMLRETYGLVIYFVPNRTLPNRRIEYAAIAEYRGREVFSIAGCNVEKALEEVLREVLQRIIEGVIVL